MKEASSLKNPFFGDIHAAIHQSKEIIYKAEKNKNFKSFEEFVQYHSMNSDVSTCQKTWNQPKLCITCLTCSNSPESCICLECFLNGNHENHDVIVNPDLYGNCDCGDTFLWKPEGFCHKHQRCLSEKSHPELLLDKELRTVLIDQVFSDAFKFMKEIVIDNPDPAILILKFAKKFVKFGDGFRRAISLALTQKINFNEFLFNIFFYSSCFNEKLSNLFGLLINDTIFLENFSYAACEVLIPIYHNAIYVSLFPFDKNQENQIYENIKCFSHLWFHCFSTHSIESNINNHEWDWVLFFKEIILAFIPLFNHRGEIIFSTIPTDVSITTSIIRCTTLQPNKLQEYLNVLISILNADLKISANFSDFFETDEYFPIDSFDRALDGYCVAFKKTTIDLNFSNLICELEKISLDSLNQNNKSLFLGASFYLAYPLIFLFTKNLENNYDQFTPLLKGNEQLIQKLGTILISNAAALICFKLSITRKNNHGLIFLLKPKITKIGCIEDGIPSFLPSLQFLIGISNDKEFFVKKLATLIGLFDDISLYEEDDEIELLQKQMRTSFIYLMTLIIIDRTMLTHNYYEYIKSQIVLYMKYKHLNDISQISLRYSHSITEKAQNIFEEVLSNVTEKSYKDGMVNYNLKKDITWNSISSAIPITKLLIVNQSEINKDPTKLLSIPEYEEPGHNMDLISLAYDKTLLSIIYDILRSTKNEVMTHLAIHLLILSSTSRKIQKNKKLKLNKKEIHYNTIEELSEKISQLDFDEFINLKISYCQEPPMSIVDILSKDESIGKEVLQKLSIHVNYDNNNHNNNNKELELQKKAKAHQLKLDIMKEYQNKISKLELDNLNDEDVTNDNFNIANDTELCSICSLRKPNEVLSYPLFIYESSIPLEFDLENHDLLNVQFDNSISGSPFSKLVRFKHELTYQFGICQHLIHKECNHFNPYLCSLDRNIRNSILPKLDEFTIDDLETNPEIWNSIQQFFSYFLSRSNSSIIAIREILRSLSYLIITYEVRLRSLPGCLDSKKYKFLAINLFLNLYFAYRKYKKPEFIGKYTLFQTFIINLIKNDHILNIENYYQTFNVDEFINNYLKEHNLKEISHEEKTLFLRRICLSEYFILNQSLNEDNNPKLNINFIDWDELLLYENLCSRYNISFDGIEDEFKPFQMIKNPPKDFLRFYLPPFNLPVDKTHKCVLWDMIARKKITIPPDQFREFLISNSSDEKLKTYLLVGQEATSIMVQISQYIGFMSPFYFDKHGSPDVGHKRGGFLYLNDHAFEMFNESIISGEFTKCLHGNRV
ncbi:hypothetical protein TRFO_28145 [Tritrichomonas foetus]|uniref:E3 ubiquitin-protein ligase n=1 Tax=Tritrichomonas foetus TaxID=1144522 RepID=A0A1J4JYU8_9EUKA|nr:hypothetical protein TRFO_28145 [Tritrichomonas foetus]|eukprot:OHT04329.1 hypothetical protein TRFO_28145 [Tritrichomonas foetus]